MYVPQTIGAISRWLEPKDVRDLLQFVDMVANWNTDVRPGHAEYQSRAAVIAEARRIAEKVGLQLDQLAE